MNKAQRRTLPPEFHVTTDEAGVGIFEITDYDLEFDAIRQLTAPPEKKRLQIGFGLRDPKKKQ
jgi:hypothetical protein